MIRSNLALGAVMSLVAVPALADITADELWALWQRGAPDATAAAADTQISADGLRLDGVSVSFGAGNRTTTMLLDQVTLDNMPDGTVRIATAQTARIVGDTFGGETRLDLSQLSVDVARDGPSVTYDATAPRVTITLPGPGDGPLSGQVTLTDLASRVTTQGNLSDPIRADSRAGSLVGDLSLPVGAGAPSDVTFSLSDVENTQEIQQPRAMLQGVPAPESTSALAFAGGDLSMAGDTPQGPAQVALSLGAARSNGAISDGQVAASGDVSDIGVSVLADWITVPSDAVTLGGLGYELQMPVLPRPQADPLRLRAVLTDLGPSDALWQAIDPEGLLPRDPARATISIGGTARVLQSDGRDRLSLPQVRLDRLDIAALGARIMGSGAVNNPENAMLADGALTLTATGLLDAIEALTTLGILPPGQAVGARMGLAFGTVPNPDGDGLRTRIGFGPDGAITLNGTRIR